MIFPSTPPFSSANFTVFGVFGVMNSITWTTQQDALGRQEKNNKGARWMKMLAAEQGGVRLHV